MTRTVALACLLLASAAAAQTPRLAVHDAFLPVHPQGAVPDTAAMERARLPGGEPVFLGPVLLGLGEGSLTDASVSFDTFTHTPEIALAMTAPAAQAFARITEARVGQSIAVVLDGRVLTAPTVAGAIPNGRVLISGSFARAEAEAIASAIRDATQADAARADLLRDLRARADLSRPDSAVAAFLRAAAARDWPEAARMLHPDAQRASRDMAEDGLTLDADSVGQTDRRVRLAVRDVLGADAPGPRWSDLSDEQAAALLFAAFGEQRPTRTAAVVVGTVGVGDAVAYVVVGPAEPTGFGIAGVSETSVVEARRVDGQWRVLLPSAGW